MTYITINIHDPKPDDIHLLSSGPNDSNPDKVPSGIRFGDLQNGVSLYLSSAHLQHDGQFTDVVTRCDQIIEYVQAIRSYALKRLARPGEELVGFISDAKEAPGYCGHDEGHLIHAHGEDGDPIAPVDAAEGAEWHFDCDPRCGLVPASAVADGAGADVEAQRG